MKALPYVAYNSVLLLLSPLVGGYLAERYVSGKSRPGWRERWGRLPDALTGKPDDRATSSAAVQPPGHPRRVWIHAVSAGEVVAAVPIMRELRARLPDYELVFSVITPAGYEMAEQQAAKYVDAIFYAPFDFPWVVRRVVRALRPRVYVSLESELWPNLLYELKRQNAATVLVNGRISDKNFARVRKYGGALFRWMLGNMDRLLMQSPSDAERVALLAGKGNAKKIKGRREQEEEQESGRIAVVGNSKFDQAIARLDTEAVSNLRRDLKLPHAAPVFVAGSTRSPEEEAQVFAAYQTMQTEIADLCLLVAPRHIERAGEVAEAMRHAGLQPVLRTELDSIAAPLQHLVLNTMGELANVYAVAAIAFVGNSFAPVNKGGGQNLLQPLAHGKPVLFGPKNSDDPRRSRPDKKRGRRLSGRKWRGTCPTGTALAARFGIAARHRTQGAGTDRCQPGRVGPLRRSDCGAGGKSEINREWKGIERRRER